MFNLQAGVDIVHIPYKGSSPAVADLVSGQVQIMFDTVSSALPQIKAGKTRALAVTTQTRSSALPDVPTLNETVLPGLMWVRGLVFSHLLRRLPTLLKTESRNR